MQINHSKLRCFEGPVLKNNPPPFFFFFGKVTLLAQEHRNPSCIPSNKERFREGLHKLLVV